LTAAWLVLLGRGNFGDAGYMLPLGMLAFLIGAWGFLRTAILDRRAFVAMLVLITFFLTITFRVRGFGDAGIDWQNGTKIITWLALLVIAALNLRRTIRYWADPVLILLACYIAITVISALYSKVPLYSGACALGVLAYLAFASLAADVLGEKGVVTTLVWTLAAFCAVSWIAVLVVPDVAFLSPYGDKEIYRLQGFSGHPNALAAQAATFILLTIGAYRRGHLRPFTCLTLVVFGVATMVATNGRTAMISVVVACVLVELQSRRLLLAAMTIAFLLVGLVVMAVSIGRLVDSEALLGMLSRTGDTDEVMTMTGRTELWSFVWEKIMQRPLFGYGFNSFEATAADEWFGSADAGVATHSNILQALFTVGIVGTLPYVGANALLVGRWFMRPNPMRDLFTLYTLVSGLTEVDYTSIATMPTFVVFAVLTMDAAVRPPASLFPTAANGCARPMVPLALNMHD
jgi:O-antigen ligase